jgi:predicted DCC family thiol-disulfide oxidoreductase YuxK
VGGRWSLDALVRLARPPGEAQRSRPVANFAVLGLTLQSAIILGGLAVAQAGETASASRGLSWALAAAAVAGLVAPCVQLPVGLRSLSAAVVLFALGWNVVLHAGEAWAWTLLAAPLALLPGAVWDALANWSTARRRLTCYFDDDCGICQAVRRTLGALDRGGNITFIGNSDPSAFRHAVPLELIERTIVVFDQRGRRLIETRAVAALLAALPFPWRAGSVIGAAGAADLADFGYRWVARNRLRISVQLGLAACGTGVKPGSTTVVEALALRRSSRSATWAALLLAVMLLRAYNANVADRFNVRAVPEPSRLHALLQMALFDQEWGEVGRGSA